MSFILNHFLFFLFPFLNENNSLVDKSEEAF